MLARITRTAINSRAVFFICLESFHFIVGGSLALILALLGVEGVRNGEHQSVGVGIRVFVEAYVLDIHPPTLVAGVEDVVGSKGYLQTFLHEIPAYGEVNAPL